MDKQKQEKLEADGWRAGTVSEFLDLTPEETAVVESNTPLTIKDLMADCQQGDVIGLQVCEKNGCCFAVVVKRKYGNGHLLEFQHIHKDAYQALRNATDMAQKRAIMIDSASKAIEGSCREDWLNECRIMPTEQVC